jgi:urease accessory protein
MRAHHLDPALPDMAFVIVSSPGGGVLQGDRLELSVDVETGARLHLDTSSATRLYRMPDRDARSEVDLRVGPGACLEVVPDPYLPFAGARFLQQTRAVVDETGILLLSEVVAGGRAARGEELRYERFESVLDVRRPSGALLYRDACRLVPAEGVLGPTRPVVGTLHVVAAGFSPDALAELPAPGGAYAGASALPNGAGAWLRVVASDVASAAAVVDAGWRTARRALLGAEPPRSRRY